MRHIVLGALLGLAPAFPHLAAGQGADPAATAARWVACQPVLWALVAGLLARPRITGHSIRRTK
ncbi:hypothetical protein ACFZAM_03050 [Streptomyces sp. NPDC008079]|uniref:hypothetical protein n=1 Tax=Streptomyces sp. NPDC008079 TaxID=3364806 RepID=UPI0036EB0260